MHLKLSRHHRSELIKGNMPDIGGFGDCPVERGHEVLIVAGLTLTVTTINRHPKGWVIGYRVRDSRFVFRNLQRTPANGVNYSEVREAFAPENFRWDEPTRIHDDEGDDDGMGSAYTPGQIGLIDDAGEAPDAEWMHQEAARIGAENSQKRAARKKAEGDDLSRRLAAAHRLVVEFDPGDDPVLQRRKRKALRALAEKEAA